MSNGRVHWFLVVLHNKMSWFLSELQYVKGSIQIDALRWAVRVDWLPTFSWRDLIFFQVQLFEYESQPFINNDNNFSLQHSSKTSPWSTRWGSYHPCSSGYVSERWKNWSRNCRFERSGTASQNGQRWPCWVFNDVSRRWRERGEKDDYFRI